MKLESQVVSLELSKKLKALGVKQESAFYWQAVQSLKVFKGVKVDAEWHLYSKTEMDRTPIFSVYDTRSAFTVAELGEMLPQDTWSICQWNGWFCKRMAGNACIDIKSNEKSPYSKEQEADTEADARAKMLIYLIEKGIVKP